ncbi:MAG TPA: adenosylcobinamide-GDP ribazoletransferase [Candidatus Omnitrophota bacterium]|nr:adenosylcobinamide-GDP ribazoletransferase [Candidatus Omnitrophota bacterium]
MNATEPSQQNIPDVSPLRRAVADLHLAAAFLTRLPLPDLGPVAEGGLARAMRGFPLVGGGLGILAGLVFMAAHSVLPAALAAVLAVLALVLLTGALHEDGLADTADGLGARGDRERRLEVMRDSRSGAYGVLALIFSIGIRAVALAQAPSGAAGLGALVAACALGRALVPAAMQVMPPARPDGLGAMAGVPDASVAALAAVLGLMLTVAGMGQAAPVVIVSAVAAALAVVAVARRALGGYTGDVLGAVVQAAEAAVLVAAVGVWQ